MDPEEISKAGESAHQLIPRAPPATDWDERTELGEVLEIAGRGGFGGAGKRDVFPGVHAPGESVRSRFEQAAEDLELALVQVVFKAL